MAISSQKIADRVYRITLSGLLTWAEFQTFLAQVETENVFSNGKIKFLLLLNEFAGWEPGEEWGDVSFFFKHDPDIEKIAVVGESRWQDEMQMFLFADYRQAEVKFFAETDLEPAHIWLMS